MHFVADKQMDLTYYNWGTYLYEVLVMYNSHTYYYIRTPGTITVLECHIVPVLN